MLAIKIKVMPTSPEINLDEMKNKIEEKIKNVGGKLHDSKQEEVAFGLKALILLISWPDEKGTDELENAISSIEGVNSVQVIDMRKAFG